ncbi:MAG: serine/threonine-protein kinase, partial [Candidatus Eisenbacteria bacterium]
MIGRRISHYRILSQLGMGGMGVVYRAHDELLQREVAIKVLPPEAMADDAARRRLLREAQLASQLNHPHISTIYEVGDAEGLAYISMELVEGRPLNVLVRPRGLPTDAAIRYGTQIAEALAYAHERGVIHRDLKCANVLITGDGRVKVLDFGLAMRVAARDDESTTQLSRALTETGAIVGTPQYLAPELLRGDVADARSDLWSLGVTLYEMTSGTCPFAGATPMELGAAILHGPPEPLPTRVPAGLSAIIHRCLAKDPAQRYRQAGEVRAALEGVVSSSASGVVGSTPRASRATALRSGPLWLWAAAAVALLLAVLVLLDSGRVRTRLFDNPSARRITSIAVLPLDNFSGDPTQQYFADGMTEELITTLAQIGTLRVISRTSVMGFKGTTLSLPEIGRKLGVGAIVEGSVQRSGDRVRITAQLIRTANEQHMWAHSYERDLRDALALQDEVATAIAKEVQAHLTPKQQKQIADARPVSPKSYELYLRALDAYRRWNKQSEQVALEFLKQAIKDDSTYAPAWAAMGLVYLEHPGPASAHDEEVARARKAAERALRLDPDLGLAHSLKAQIEYQEDFNWEAAERGFKRAGELAPSLFEAHHYYSHLLIDMGRVEESFEQSRIALALDPLNTAVTLHMGWH